MEYLIGIAVAFAVTCGAKYVGFDRSRAFYPSVLIVVATYYVLFAAMGPARGVSLGLELAFAAGFTAMAVLGFKRNLMLVAVAIAGHGVFDWLHHLFIANPGVPVWWPGFCGSADLVLGGWLAVCLLIRK